MVTMRKSTPELSLSKINLFEHFILVERLVKPTLNSM